MRGGVPARHLVIGAPVRLQREAIDRHPAVADLRLQLEPILMLESVARLMRRFLFGSRLEADRTGHGEAAEPHIGKERALRKLDAHQHVRTHGVDLFRRHPAARPISVVTSKPMREK